MNRFRHFLGLLGQGICLSHISYQPMAAQHSGTLTYILPSGGFEPTIPVFERFGTICGLNRVVTRTGVIIEVIIKILSFCSENSKAVSINDS